VSRYFNDNGEPLMTAAQARFEDELDMESVHEPMDPGDYADSYGRQDAFWEDLYERQEDGDCPACGEQGCDLRLRYSRDEYTGEGVVYHDARDVAPDAHLEMAYEDAQVGE
jgi:hypothetical protein